MAGTQRLDWDHSARDGSSTLYARRTDEAVLPLLGKEYTSIEKVEEDLSALTKNLITIAESTIKRYKPQRKSSPHIKDALLSTLCWQSRVAFRKWKEGGRPTNGPLFDDRKKAKKEVAKHLSKCRAKIEQQKISSRDKMFSSQYPKRFKTSFSPTSCGSSIVAIVSDPDTVLAHWADHFASLGEFRYTSNPVLQNSITTSTNLEADSFAASDTILDSPIVLEEMEYAISHLKRNSSGGPDSLCPNHIKLSGPSVKKWICQIFNHIISLEEIPSVFTCGTIIPIYKGKGKDPLEMSNYRGITLTSVLAKTFEIILLNRMLPCLSDFNIPYPTQTAYQKGVACSDATFSCLEIISKYIRDGDSVYSCFYDLASAFDTVEYPVLLNSLAKSGICGKSWRLIKQWYTGVKSQVRVNGSTFVPFPTNRGVRQGSVLSPVLFLLVMDPLLIELMSKSCGLNVFGLDVGAFAHADDIRSLATNLVDCQKQISTVKHFCNSKGLTLNADKCEAVIFHSPPSSNSIISEDFTIPLSHAARCLGAWWTPNLSCSHWIECNIKKARAAFLHVVRESFWGLSTHFPPEVS